MAGPRIQQALQLTPAEWGSVGGVFAFSYGLFEIPSGYLGDRIGVRAVLSRIVLCWSGFTALTGAVWNYMALLVTRFLFGYDTALIPIACMIGVSTVVCLRIDASEQLFPEPALSSK